MKLYKPRMFNYSVFFMVLFYLGVGKGLLSTTTSTEASFTTVTAQPTPQTIIIQTVGPIGTSKFDTVKIRR